MPISVPPIPYLDIRQPQIDPRAISGIGDSLIGALDRRRELGMERRTQEAFQGGIPTRPDGSPDYAAMAARLFQAGNVDTGLGLTRLAETQAQNLWERQQPQFFNMGEALLQSGPQGVEEVYREPEEPKPPIRVGQSIVDPETFQPLYTDPTRSTITATDRRAIHASEDENVNLEGTIEALNRAKELNASTFSGFGAGMRGRLGAKLPDALVPNVIAEPGAANATVEWQNIMSPEAIKSMSATLTGATTNFELQKFEQILSDPSTPPDIRQRTIDRMLQLAERKRALNASRIQELRATGGQVPGGAVFNEEGGVEDIIAGPQAPTLNEPQPQSEAEYQSLPPGTVYIAPDGSRRVKP